MDNIKLRIVGARERGDEEAAKTYSEAREHFRHKRPGRCVRCGVTITKAATHCRTCLVARPLALRSADSLPPQEAAKANRKGGRPRRANHSAGLLEMLGYY